MLVLIEGLDFAGKTTLLQRATLAMQERGLRVVPREGGSLTGGWYRDLLLKGTEQHALPNWVTSIVSGALPIVDRLAFRPPQGTIILHTTYLERAIAYETARGSVLRRLWLTAARHIAVDHDVRILLRASFEIRRMRYLALNDSNPADDWRFQTPEGRSFSYRMETALDALAQHYCYRIIDTSEQSVGETVDATLATIEAARGNSTR